MRRNRVVDSIEYNDVGMINCKAIWQFIKAYLIECYRKVYNYEANEHATYIEEHIFIALLRIPLLFKITGLNTSSYIFYYSSVLYDILKCIVNRTPSLPLVVTIT